MQTILNLKNVNKIFETKNRRIQVLNDISFSVKEKSTCAIIGPSGSGKTTLLGICAGLDHSTSGIVEISGQNLNEMDEDQRAQLRNDKVGFVFQNFQLIPTLTALENIMVPAELSGNLKSHKLAEELLANVGLADRADHYPVQLSGGEQQRIAVARAFINEPDILFADEPTGNLDEETSNKITELLFELNREKGTTLIIVTHNIELAEKNQHIIKLKGGQIIENLKRDFINEAN